MIIGRVAELAERHGVTMTEEAGSKQECIRRKDCKKQPESAASKVTLSGHNCGLDTGQLFA